jgi:hypothetical protein
MDAKCRGLFKQPPTRHQLVQTTFSKKIFEMELTNAPCGAIIQLQGEGNKRAKNLPKKK